MSQIDSLFVPAFTVPSSVSSANPLDQNELLASCLSIADDDEAGQNWCEENGYPGYTSYASLTDLPWRFPVFKEGLKNLPLSDLIW